MGEMRVAKTQVVRSLKKQLHTLGNPPLGATSWTIGPVPTGVAISRYLLPASLSALSQSCVFRTATPTPTRRQGDAQAELRGRLSNLGGRGGFYSCETVFVLQKKSREERDPRPMRSPPSCTDPSGGG